MHPFGLEVLLLPTFLVSAVAMVVSAIATKSPAFGIAAGLIKAGLFLWYFGYAFDGTYTFTDDRAYMEGGEDFIFNEVGLSNLWENMDLALLIGQGDNFLYYLYNAYAFR